MSVLDTLKAASPSRKSVTLCLDAALQAQWDTLLAGLDAAGKADTDSGSLALPNVTRAVNEMDELRAQVAASEVTFVFEKMDWQARLALQSAHPPRSGHVLDRAIGANSATFYPVLIKASCISVTGADGDAATEIPDEVWDGLLGAPAAGETVARAGSLNMGQVDRLIAAANFVNDGTASVPPSARSLLESQDSGTSLAQPGPGTSLPGASTAGSRPTSQKSSGTRKATPTKGKSTAT